MVSTLYNRIKNQPKRPIVCKKGPPPQNRRLIVELVADQPAPNRHYTCEITLYSADVETVHIHVHSSIATTGPQDFDANVTSPGGTTCGFKIGSNHTATCQVTATWPDGTVMQVTESITIP